MWEAAVFLLFPAAAQLGFGGFGNVGGIASGSGSVLGGPLGGLSGGAGGAAPLLGQATPLGGGIAPLGGVPAAGIPSGVQAPPCVELVPGALNKAFHYADIASQLLTKPSDIAVEACRQLCVSNSSCAAWEVCAPLGDGCDGCYHIKRAPRRFAERPCWHAEVIEGREQQGEPMAAASDMTDEACHDYLLEANGADQNQPFHEPENMKRYIECGFKIRDAEKTRRLAVLGKHYPTFVMTHFSDPSIELPADVESQLFSQRQQRQQPPLESPGITSQLHQQVGTTSWDDHLQQKPSGPHAFVLPFFDTNIGHWIKQHGSMNPLQSYEMQSLLQRGDVFVDVGANLGCYTVPMAERVGTSGKVLAFEPFRLLHQITTANVALNGIGNAWVFPVGLSTEFSRFEARPPQLKFFSSPGGMKLHNQQDGLKQEEQLQLYDWDTPPEAITVVSLDELMLQSERASLLGFPVVHDVRLIKIDVEGMEKEVIMGAQQTIRHFKPIIWTENVAYFQSKGEDTSLLQVMDQLEYACAGAQNAPNDLVCTDKHGRGHQVVV